MTNKTLREESQDYVPKKTLNITDLDKVDLSWSVQGRTGIDKDEKEFHYKVMVVNEIEYRIANTVLEEIKKMLKLKPDLKFVRVTKSGSGMGTRYSVEMVE